MPPTTTSPPDTTIANVSAWKRKARAYIDRQDQIDTATKNLEDALNEVRQRFEPELHKLKSRQAQDGKALDEFALRRSDELVGGSTGSGEEKTYTYTVRLCPPALTVDPDLEEKEIFQRLRKMRLSNLIKKKESLDRAAAKNADDKKLAACGITFTRNRKLYLKKKGD